MTGRETAGIPATSDNPRRRETRRVSERLHLKNYLSRMSRVSRRYGYSAVAGIPLLCLSPSARATMGQSAGSSPSSPAVTGGPDLPSTCSSTGPHRLFNSTGGRCGGPTAVIDGIDGPPTKALGGDDTAAAVSQSLLSRFSLLAGVAVYPYSGQAFAAPALAARFAVSEKWSVEAGGSLETSAGSTYREVDRTASGFWFAHIDSASEIHLAGIYSLPRGHQNWVAPELTLGLSQLTVHNIVVHYPTAVSNTDFYDSPGAHAWSPTLGLGVRLFAPSPVTLNLGLTYANYSNTVEEPGQTFNLGLNGLNYSARLEVRL